MRTSRNVCMYLTEEQCSFLLNIAGECANEGVPGLSTQGILRTLIRLLQHLEVDVSGVRTEDELLQRLEDAARTEILNDIAFMPVDVTL